jgi:hypothetical protein
MPISIVCGGCGTRLTFPDSAAGAATTCPKCHAALMVADAEPPQKKKTASTRRLEFSHGGKGPIRAPEPEPEIETSGQPQVVPPNAPAPSGSAGLCPRCHTQVVGGARICVNCGFNLMTGKPISKRFFRFVLPLDVIIKLVLLTAAIIFVAWAAMSGAYKKWLGIKDDAPKPQAAARAPSDAPANPPPQTPAVNTPTVPPAVNTSTQIGLIAPIAPVAPVAPPAVPIDMPAEPGGGWRTYEDAWYRISMPPRTSGWQRLKTGRYVVTDGDIDFVLSIDRYPGMNLTSAQARVIGEVASALDRSLRAAPPQKSALGGKDAFKSVIDYAADQVRHTEWVVLRESWDATYAVKVKGRNDRWFNRRDEVEKILRNIHLNADYGRPMNETLREEAAEMPPGQRATERKVPEITPPSPPLPPPPTLPGPPPK